MPNKISQAIDRQELAEVLEEIAGHLRQGAFQLEGRRWPVPDTLAVKLKHKEKKGRIKTRIEWHWSTLADYDDAAREKVERWQSSLKEVKKRLGRTFKAMRQAVGEGRLPSESLLEDFVADSRAMDALADPDWKEAMDAYLDHMANLLAAARSGQLDIVAHELRDLAVRMKACHREFK